MEPWPEKLPNNIKTDSMELCSISAGALTMFPYKYPIPPLIPSSCKHGCLHHSHFSSFSKMCIRTFHTSRFHLWKCKYMGDVPCGQVHAPLVTAYPHTGVRDVPETYIQTPPMVSGTAPGFHPAPHKCKKRADHLP